LPLTLGHEEKMGASPLPLPRAGRGNDLKWSFCFIKPGNTPSRGTLPAAGRRNYCRARPALPAACTCGSTSPRPRPRLRLRPPPPLPAPKGPE
jgi:hypothetical protein